MKKSELFFNTLLLPVDFLMIVFAGIATYLLRTKIFSSFRPVLFEFNLPLEKYFLLVFLVSVLFIGIFAISGLYKLRTTTGRIEEFFRVAIASSAGVMVLIVYIFLRQELFNSRFLILGGWFLSVVFVSLGRFLVRYLQKRLVAMHDFGVHRVLVIGDDKISNKLTQEISQNRAIGYRIVKHLENPEVAEVKLAIGSPGIDEVILANPNYPGEKILEIVDFCNENHLTFKFVPNIYQTLTTNFSIDVLAGVPMIELRRTNLDGWGRVIKRFIDIVFSSLALLVFSPLFLIATLAIKWETEGSVFVRLRRVSQNKEFNLLKFRSMIKNAEDLKPFLADLNERKDGPLFKIKNDPRVTKVGRFIRHYRLDELPQFLNIIRGDISLVGPRPHQPDEISKYQKHQKKVLSIKAGATGLAQVSGSSDLPFEEEVTLDSFYIENWSLFQDLKIILKTIGKMFTDRSAV
ncbi:MAG: sugar transferase [Candidatus Yanofskybacteria bacterium]|nr:sugar transferase [Candidatus Yanofskybacteria bacterium]